MTARVPSLLVMLSAAACATTGATAARQALMEQATFDLACSRDELKVFRLAADKTLVDVGSGLPVTRSIYQVRGCGDTRIYYVDCAGAEDTRCQVKRVLDASGNE
jgi:hypothetical protein